MFFETTEAITKASEKVEIAVAAKAEAIVDFEDLLQELGKNDATVSLLDDVERRFKYIISIRFAGVVAKKLKASKSKGES